MATLPPLIAALHDPRRYDHPVERVTLVETHISWVLLAGAYAYKIKKPVDLRFLDFSTLEKRRFCCEEELRLNRRLAPQIYLAVVPIAGTTAEPQLGGGGEPIEYAVKMARFDTEQELDKVLARGELRPEHVDELAALLASFHRRVAVADPDSPYGTPARVWHPVQENFEQIGARIGAAERPQVERLRAWSESAFARLKDSFAARKRGGFVRECHGDAHLANMVLLDGHVTLFDCLEFNPNLRWIDVMSEVAFLTMDLQDRGRPDLARRALNGYLEHTGDYPGLAVLTFYQVYRALVRAKVAAIRTSQEGIAPEEARAAREQYAGYTTLAERYTQPRPAPLVITHGVSGSGKTWITQRLLEQLDAVRVRSDIERKRLHGLEPLARSASGLDAGLYTADAGERTYRRLAELTGTILDSGFAAIVDATFLKRAQRAQLREVAAARGVPFVILAPDAPRELLRARVAGREREARDASEAGVAVLERQLASIEPLDEAERAAAVMVPTDDAAVLARGLADLARRLGTV
jgi:hypothetical protein